MLFEAPPVIGIIKHRRLPDVERRLVRLEILPRRDGGGAGVNRENRPLVIIGRNHRVGGGLDFVAHPAHLLARDGKGCLHGFEPAGPHVARLEVVDEVGPAPDVAVVQDRDIALHHDLARGLEFRRLVKEDGRGLVGIDETVAPDVAGGQWIQTGSRDQGRGYPSLRLVVLDRRKPRPEAARAVSAAKVFSSRASS